MADYFAHQGKWRRAVDYVKAENEEARPLSDTEISGKFRKEILSRYEALGGLYIEMEDPKPEPKPRKVRAVKSTKRGKKAKK